MSRIELINKKIIENLKNVRVTGGELSSYINGGGRPPIHGQVDRKEVEEMKEEQNWDRNTDKEDVDM
jgi:hypothetical protein